MSTDTLNTIWMELMIIVGLYQQYYFFRKSPLSVERKWKEIIPYVLFFLWVNICSIFRVDMVIKLVIQVVVFILAARCIYAVKMREIVMKTFLYLFILVASEMFVVQVWDIFEPAAVFIEDGKEREILHYGLQIVIYVFSFGIMYFVEKLFYGKKIKVYVLEDMIPFIISMLSAFAVNLCIYLNMEVVENDKYTAVFLVCSLLILILFIYNSDLYAKRMERKQEEQNEKQALFEMEMQKNYYERKLEDEEKLKSIYHDFKNHLLILEEHEKDEKSKAIKEIREKISRYKNYQSTGNKYLDIILEEKSALARKEGIDVATDIAAGAVNFISSLDISSIFGNLFDNAIEACGEVSDARRFIKLKIQIQNSLLIIVMVNSDRGNSEYNLKTSKEDKSMHGFGIKNIVRSLQKYEGYYSINRSDGEFRFNITIPISDN